MNSSIPNIHEKQILHQTKMNDTKNNETRIDEEDMSEGKPVTQVHTFPDRAWP